MVFLLGHPTEQRCTGARFQGAHAMRYVGVGGDLRSSRSRHQSTTSTNQDMYQLASNANRRLQQTPISYDFMGLVASLPGESQATPNPKLSQRPISNCPSREVDPRKIQWPVPRCSACKAGKSPRGLGKFKEFQSRMTSEWLLKNNKNS